MEKKKKKLLTRVLFCRAEEKKNRLLHSPRDLPGDRVTRPREPLLRSSLGN